MAKDMDIRNGDIFLSEAMMILQECVQNLSKLPYSFCCSPSGCLPFRVVVNSQGDAIGETSGIRFAKAQVNGVNGVILGPDDWNVTTYNLNNTNESGASYTSNVMSGMVWQNTFESVGAVFLPAAGYRYGTSVSNASSYGYYWSASYSTYTYSSYTYAYAVDFGNSNLAYDSWVLYWGQSVRLVCPAE